MTNKTVYLAGPDVFLPDARAVLEEKKKQLELMGYNVFTPIDDETGQSWAAWAFCGWNERRIKASDIIVADVQPFRGTEPDSGTVFEIGYAVALSKRVITYNNPKLTYATRCHDYDQCFGSKFNPEQFSLKQNLMISCSVSEEVGSWEECLEILKEEM